VHQKWLDETVQQVDQNPKDLHPVLKEFKDMIESDTHLRLLFNSMFSEIPKKKPYSNDPEGKHQVRDHVHLLKVINHLIFTAPEWSDHAHDVGVVGVPFNALLDWPMATASGYAVFLDPKVNAMLKKVLNVWGDYLQSPESAYVLENKSDCWLGPTGKKDLAEVANIGNTKYSFEELFICDPKKKCHGYKSWDDFFTRHFHEGIRPVAHPEDDSVIVNSCESQPYRVSHNVAAHDKFWVKGQPYSVMDMLANDPLAEQFVGGTVYQAFLSSLSYHRWHSPVSGKVVKQYVVDGTYFSEPLFEGFADPHGPDPNGEGTGQGFISAIATRGIIFIEADNPDIGLMCVMPVGMVEVSTCDITVKQGQHLKKGDELGMVSLYSLNKSWVS
jgi:phosphatidylserine decarboxylase